MFEQLCGLTVVLLFNPVWNEVSRTGMKCHAFTASSRQVQQLSSRLLVSAIPTGMPGKMPVRSW